MLDNYSSAKTLPFVFRNLDEKHQSAQTVVKTFGKRRIRENFGSGARYACM